MYEECLTCKLNDCNPSSPHCRLKKQKKTKKPAGNQQRWELKKKCSCCKQEKPLSAFAKSNSKADGLQSYCNDCVKLRHYNKQKWTEKDEIAMWKDNKNLKKMLPVLRERNWGELNGDKIIKVLEGIIR